MKVKLSVSVDKEALESIENSVKEGRFRNKSHAVEYAVNKLMRER